MSTDRIASAIVIVWSAASLALAVIIFVSLPGIESPERYIALVFGLVMLYMGGSMAAGLIWPTKPRDRNAPIEVPPLDQVHGRTSYRESAMTRNGLLAIGAIFLAITIAAAPGQPIVIVFALIAAGFLIGAAVVILRQIQYGRARLQLEAPARRGDLMRGVITTSGFGWSVAGRKLRPKVEIIAYRRYRTTQGTRSIAVGQSSAVASTTRDGNKMTIRFSVTIPLIDTSEGRYSWNVDLETRDPRYDATFVVDVA